MAHAPLFIGQDGVEINILDAAEDAFLDGGVGLFELADQLFGFGAEWLWPSTRQEVQVSVKRQAHWRN